MELVDTNAVTYDNNDNGYSDYINYYNQNDDLRWEKVTFLMSLIRGIR
jgi:hypothetical protein